MHLEYQALLQADPELEDRLRSLPGATFSGRTRPAKGVRGVFFCYALPALDKERGEFTEAAGTTRWYLVDLDRDTVLEEPAEIVASIRSTRHTAPLHHGAAHADRDQGQGREAHQKHLPQARRRAGGVKPVLKCWMELT